MGGGALSSGRVDSDEPGIGLGVKTASPAIQQGASNTPQLKQSHPTYLPTTRTTKTYSYRNSI